MSENKTFWDKVRIQWRAITSMAGELDTVSAATKIRKGINVRGTTVWILVCSIVIASVCILDAISGTTPPYKA